MYENIDEIKTAKQRIYKLRQTESISEYAVKFQQYAIKTN